MSNQSLVALVLINRPVTEVWEYWTHAKHILQWNVPFDDWHCPEVENDLTAGGRFKFYMEKKDGSDGFEHTGVYDQVAPFEMIAYTLNDGRRAWIEFQQIDSNTIVRERFEPELHTAIELQKEFCQSVLNRFKNYVEQQ
ncbi:SRPBCC domain-containing protein [Niabella yanshanensis]|uniref:SRPBCC domain-containing protein n=1 Tax=Niabella yanshanensis TaxID=577386 RepID=A0ABZ0WCJ5_9BACT|nr:SRPBCC domain-containing protein [Niabella yanshanensis]WQD40543.1 SRPBCC domain-containing protein [Niabella yanshanensis]